MIPSLPQDDKKPDVRHRQLGDARETWRYAYDWPPGVATTAELPRSADFSLGFKVQAVEAYLSIAANLAAMAVQGVGADLEAQVRQRVENITPDKLHEHLLSAPRQLAALFPDRRPETWDEYRALYATWQPPDVVRTFCQGPRSADLAFAWQRIAGVNPMILARCDRIPDHFPVTERVFCSVLEGDSLEAALAEGRVFLADYALLDGVETGVTDGARKFLPAPLALCAVERATGDLLPVAIQTGQKPDVPLWTPSDGWRWWMARVAVQIADANVHEGLTHLVMEAVMLALHRQLAKRHPLHVLLARLDRLGGYRDRHFVDPRVGPLLASHREALDQAEAVIQERNAHRTLAYPWMVPSRVPLSIQV